MDYGIEPESITIRPVRSITSTILCVASYDVISRVNMDASNKRNLKIIIAVIAASIVIRILLYYIIAK
jgi:hypothetical protein